MRVKIYHTDSNGSQHHVGTAEYRPTGIILVRADELVIYYADDIERELHSMVAAGDYRRTAVFDTEAIFHLHIGAGCVSCE